jgi:hypothetical protein
LREANFLLAIGACALALFLALPVLDFGAISARNQMARLESGKVNPEEFDFAALRWDFGDAGREALAKLAKGKGRVAELATAALEQKQRVYGARVRTAEDFPLRVQPEGPQVRRLVIAYLQANPWACRETCVAVDLGASAQGRRKVALVQETGVEQLELPAEMGASAGLAPTPSAPGPILKANSRVEIREVPKRYVFVDGKPVGSPLD